MENKWIKFTRIDEKKKIIYLPTKFINAKGTEQNLYYGLNKVEVSVLPMEVKDKEGQIFNDPLIIRCSGEMLDELMIKENLIYQLLIKKDNIYIDSGFYRP